MRYARNRRHWTRGLGATARAEGRRRRDTAGRRGGHGGRRRLLTCPAERKRGPPVGQSRRRPVAQRAKDDAPSGAPVSPSRGPAPPCARCRGCRAPVRWCGGAVAPDRREASVREAPSDDLAKPRPLKGMSKELWALGRAVQALQADDDATSGVSRPLGPDATGPGNTTTPADGRAEGHPMLPDRACSPILSPDPLFASSVPRRRRPHDDSFEVAPCRPVTGYIRVRTNTVPWRITVRCSIRRLVIGPGRSAR